MKRGLLWLAGLLFLIEVVVSIATMPPASQQPAASARPMLEGAQVDPHVMAILDRSCRDCHSDVTHYPWYSYIAPVSALITRDVERGREYLNMSRWNEYSRIRKQRALSGIANQISTGGMPLDFYLWLHPEAQLSAADQKLLFDWTQNERRRLILESSTSSQ
jgi:hypothetical protein